MDRCQVVVVHQSHQGDSEVQEIVSCSPLRTAVQDKSHHVDVVLLAGEMQIVPTAVGV